MSVEYRSVPPLSQQATYEQNQNIEFELSLDGKKLIPGTVVLDGLCAIYADKSTSTGTLGHQEIAYDPISGYHGLIHDITTEVENLGIVENLQQYPRLVKEARLCTEQINSLGTETRNSVEGCAPTDKISSGLAEGIGGNRGVNVPFSLKLNCIINKMSAPVSGAAAGNIKFRLRLASEDEFLFGEDYVSGTSGYVLSNLRLRFQTMPDDGSRQNITAERYHYYSVNLDTNNQNVSAFVPGVCDAAHLSFIKITNQNNPKYNFYACEVPPGRPPLGASPVDATAPEYGVERLFYAVNDVDTALVGFTMESREELMRSGIRSFNGNADSYNTLARRLRNDEYPDGYVLGIPFGGPIMLNNNKFAAEIQTQCTTNNQYQLHMHFRCIQEVTA